MKAQIVEKLNKFLNERPQINKEFDEYANGTGKYSPNMKGMKSSIESLAGRKIDGVEWQGVSAAVYPKVQEFREKNGYDPSPAQMAQWGAEEVAQQAIASTKTGEFVPSANVSLALDDVKKQFVK